MTQQGFWFLLEAQKNFVVTIALGRVKETIAGRIPHASKKVTHTSSATGMIQHECADKQTAEFLRQRVKPVTTDAHKRALIAEAIKLHVNKLFRTICVYARKAGLGQGEELQTVATECMSEVVERALRHADRYDPNRQAIAWLLGIASNVVLQEKHKRLKQKRREPFLQDMIADNDNQQRGDWLAKLLPSTGIEQDILARDHFEKLIMQAPESERELLYKSLIEQHSAKELATHFGSTPGAIRVRLFRVLKRLRHTLERKEHHELMAR